MVKWFKFHKLIFLIYNNKNKIDFDKNLGMNVNYFIFFQIILINIVKFLFYTLKILIRINFIIKTISKVIE